ncbi:hypothetical protein GCM10010193_42340 [Kitasatospora atroaurantiaca]|uniref:Integral membrane protein n=1 Tax=Kitasatospora atroaurantiaca TaxID=285545 RepID=A0A561EU12_9ACTN|nr:hypothetical protein [Kitasatospora atroaurantiaca]TWE19096.1 hypothetical protein FB465_4198 [Kitasatospora atroaurantiaca]
MRKAALVATGLVLAAEALLMSLLLGAVVVVALTIDPEPDRPSPPWTDNLWLGLAVCWVAVCIWGAVRTFGLVRRPRTDGWAVELVLVAVGHALAALPIARTELWPYAVLLAAVAGLTTLLAVPATA